MHANTSTVCVHYIEPTYLIGMGRADKHILNVKSVEGECQFWAHPFPLDPERKTRLSAGHVTIGHPRVARGREGGRRGREGGTREGV